MKKISNVFSQGQGGANFEFSVQTAFVITLLLNGKFPFLPPKGIANFIKLQASGSGYNFMTDDIFLDYQSENGQQHKLLVQVKHNLVFSKNNHTFLKVIKDAWEDFNSINFNPSFDRILIVKGNLTNREYNHLIQILDWARYKISASDFYNEVNAIEAKKYFLNTFQDALQYSNEGNEISQETIWKFLKCFSVIGYDFNVDNGKDKTHFLNLIERATPHNSTISAKDIWNRVFEFVSKADSKGASINLSNLPQEIKDSFETNIGISFFVHHKDSPPLSFDYFYQNGELIKSFTESECRFKIIIENKSSSAFVIDKLLVKTLNFKKIKTRILRLNSRAIAFKLL